MCDLNKRESSDYSFLLSSDGSLFSTEGIITGSSLKMAIINAIKSSLESIKASGVIKLPPELFFHHYLDDTDLIRFILADAALEKPLKNLAQTFNEIGDNVDNMSLYIKYNPNDQITAIILSNLYKFNYLTKQK
jgi:hypothetical protein